MAALQHDQSRTSQRHPAATFPSNLADRAGRQVVADAGQHLVIAERAYRRIGRFRLKIEDLASERLGNDLMRRGYCPEVPA